MLALTASAAPLLARHGGSRARPAAAPRPAPPNLRRPHPPALVVRLPRPARLGPLASVGPSGSTASQPAPVPPILKAIPTALTLARVAAVPALVAAWFAAPPAALPLVSATLFTAAAVTDFLDGALARRWGACTPFGAFLDPVADKLMVCTAVVLLAARASTAPAWWGPAAGWALPTAAAAITGREVGMSALREWAAALGGAARSSVAVSWTGKLKTASQMVAVAVLLATSGGGAGGFPAGVVPLLEAAAPVGPPLLLASAGLGLVSLGQYVVALWPWLSGAEKA